MMFHYAKQFRVTVYEPKWLCLSDYILYCTLSGGWLFGLVETWTETGNVFNWKMCISIEAYRASIGLFNNCTRDCLKTFSYPNLLFFHNNNSNFRSLRSWSMYLKSNTVNKQAIRSNILLRQMIAISIVIQTIIILANDTELNPGPRSPDSLCDFINVSFSLKEGLSL